MWLGEVNVPILTPDTPPTNWDDTVNDNPLPTRTTPFDGFSKVLFPISAKTRIPCVTPLVLLVQKIILKIQVKCSNSTSLDKKVLRFLQKELAPNFFCHAVVCTKDLRGDTESSKNERQCDFFTVPRYKLMLSCCGTPSPL